MANEKPHTLFVYFGTKTAKVNKPYKNPVEYYDPYFKEMHRFDGSRVRTSFDYRLKDYDAIKESSISEDTEEEYKRKSVSVSCPYCGKHWTVDTKKLVKDKGEIICKCPSKCKCKGTCKCEHPFVITPKGQMIYVETWSIKSSSVVSNEDDIKKWIRENERYYNIWADLTNKNWDGLTVFCSDSDVDAFVGELQYKDLDFEISDTQRWQAREYEKKRKNKSSEDEEDDKVEELEQDQNED